MDDMIAAALVMDDPVAVENVRMLPPILENTRLFPPMVDAASVENDPELLLKEGAEMEDVTRVLILA